MRVHKIKHPLVQHKLSLMRVEGVSAKGFIMLASEVGAQPTCEATKDLVVEDHTLTRSL